MLYGSIRSSNKPPVKNNTLPLLMLSSYYTTAALLSQANPTKRIKVRLSMYTRWQFLIYPAFGQRFYFIISRMECKSIKPKRTGRKQAKISLSNLLYLVLVSVFLINRNCSAIVHGYGDLRESSSSRMVEKVKSRAGSDFCLCTTFWNSILFVTILSPSVFQSKCTHEVETSNEQRHWDSESMWLTQRPSWEPVKSYYMMAFLGVPN